MAGPRFLGVRDVVNPYRDLQAAVSGVGDIYNNYAENVRRQEQHQLVTDEANRVQGLRDFASSYDPQVGVDFRGIDPNKRSTIESTEARAREVWQQQNPNATPEQQAEFDSSLLAARSQLANREDLTHTIAEDFVRQGFDTQDAFARAAIIAGNRPGRGEYLANLQAEIDARNEAAEQQSDRLLSLLQIQSAAANTGIRAAGTGGSGGSGGGGRGVSVVTPEQSEALYDHLKDRIGSRDSRKAMANIEQGYQLYNQAAVAAGGTPLSWEQIQAAAVSNLTRRGFWSNNDATFSSPEEFAANILSAQYGAPGSRVGGDRLAALESMRATLSPEQYEAIVNPARFSVNSDDAILSRIEQAYASFFPDAARTNPVVQSNQSSIPRPDSPPAGGNASPAGRGIVSPPDLEEGETRGSGREELPGSGTDTPIPRPEQEPENLGVGSASELAVTVASARARGGQDSADAERALQALSVSDPSLYRAVRQELAAGSRLDRERDALERRIERLSRNLSDTPLEELSSSHASDYTFAPPTEFQRELQLREQIGELRQRLQDLDTNIESRGVPSMDRLDAILRTLR